MNHRWIFKDGLAIPEPDLMIWACWMEDERSKLQHRDKVLGIRISTVFLGLDHSFGIGEPVLWETMIFDDDAGTALEQHRFSFQDEAYEFHDNAVKAFRLLLDKWPLHPTIHD